MSLSAFTAFGSLVRAYLRSEGGPTRAGGDGSDATGWLDASILGIDATLVAGWSAPTVPDTPGYDGLLGPVARHSDNFGFNTGFTRGATWSFAAVFRATDLSSFRNIISGPIAGGNSVYLNAGVLALEDSFATEVTSTTLAINTVYTLMVVRTTASYRIYVDGALIHTSSLTPAATDVLITAAYQSTNAPWTGDWWSIVIYDDDQSSNSAGIHASLLSEAGVIGGTDADIVESAPLGDDALDTIIAIDFNIAETAPLGDDTISTGSYIAAELSENAPLGLDELSAIIATDIDIVESAPLGLDSIITFDLDWSDDFEYSGTLQAWITFNASALPDVTASDGRYRAHVTSNASEVTLWFHDDYGRLDYRMVSGPAELIALNIGIGTPSDSQETPIASGNPYIFSGLHINGDLNNPTASYQHLVCGYRGVPAFGGNGLTVEGKTTVSGLSTVNALPNGTISIGRVDMRVLLDGDGEATFFWRSVGDTAWIPYTMPDPMTYTYPVAVGLVTYAFGPDNIPFVGTCDETIQAFTVDVEIAETAPLGGDESDVITAADLNISENAPLGNDEAGTAIAIGMEVAETAPLGSDSLGAIIAVDLDVVENAPLGSDEVGVAVAVELNTAETAPLGGDETQVSIATELDIAEAAPLGDDNADAIIATGIDIAEAAPLGDDNADAIIATGIDIAETAPLGNDEVDTLTASDAEIAAISETAPLGSDEVGVAVAVESNTTETAPLGGDEFETTIAVELNAAETAPLGDDEFQVVIATELDINEAAPLGADTFESLVSITSNIFEMAPLGVELVITDNGTAISENAPLGSDIVEVAIAMAVLLSETAPLGVDQSSTSVIVNALLFETAPLGSDALIADDGSTLLDIAETSPLGQDIFEVVTTDHILSITTSVDEVVYGIPKFFELTCNLPSTIFYTIDGSEPTIDSLIYIDRVFLPFDISKIRIRAFSINNDSRSNDIDQTYQINLSDKNLRLPGSGTTDPAGKNIPGLYPFGTNNNNQTNVFTLPGSNTGVNVSTTTNFSNGFDGQGNPNSFTDEEYNKLNYNIIYSKTNSIGEIGRGIGNLPGKVTLQKKEEIPDTSDQFMGLFNPKSTVIFQDFSLEDPNGPITINKQHFSLEDPNINRSGLHYYATSHDSPSLNGSFLRYYFNAKTQKLTSYYFDSWVNRWIISTSPYYPKNNLQDSLSGPIFMRGNGVGKVYQWIPFQKRFIY